NHESVWTSTEYGFFSEVSVKYDASIYESFMGFFRSLPLATVCRQSTPALALRSIRQAQQGVYTGHQAAQVASSTGQEGDREGEREEDAPSNPFDSLASAMSTDTVDTTNTGECEGDGCEVVESVVVGSASDSSTQTSPHKHKHKHHKHKHHKDHKHGSHSHPDHPPSPLTPVILVVHGGIPSRESVTMGDICSLQRDQEPSYGTLGSILWTDPHPGTGYIQSMRPFCRSFGTDVTRHFLKANALTHVVRSHEMVSGHRVERGHLMPGRKGADGASMPAYHCLVTLFSAAGPTNNAHTLCLQSPLPWDIDLWDYRRIVPAVSTPSPLWTFTRVGDAGCCVM
ncbi:serine/threonine protein phosphatase 5, partial [Kipferlia bialata]